MADTKHPGAASPVEGDGISYSGIVWFVVILTVVTLVCQILMWVLLRAFQQQTVAVVSPVASVVSERQAAEGRVYPEVRAIGPAEGPQPQLLVNEPANLAEFRKREQELLTTYGWIDRNAGVIRLPIERAKDLVLERGFAVRGK